MNKHGNKKPGGFTLVEILITLLVFSIVMTALFSSFKAFAISSRQIRESLDQSQEIKNLFKRITSDLEAVYLTLPPQYKQPEPGSDPDLYRFTGTRETVTGLTAASTLRFASLAHTPFIPGDRIGVAVILYYLRPNSNQGFDLCRSDVLIPDTQNLKSCSDPVVCKDVMLFDITYVDQDGEEFDYWDSESLSFGYTFPAALNIKIQTRSVQHDNIYETAMTLVPSRRPID